MSYEELNIEITPEQESIRKETRKFAKEVLRPASLELDRLHDPEEVISHPAFQNAMKKGFELGYHTILVPETWGGMGLDPLEAHMVFEELAWGSADFAVALGAASFPAFMASMVPNDRLEEEIIKPYCACTDASMIGCWAITEPAHGSDTLCPGTEQFCDPAITGEVSATLDGEEWVLRGQKAAWVSNGTIATHATVYLTIDPSLGMAGGGICIVPLDLAGVKKGKPLNKMGQRALNQGEIYFDNVRVPKDYMVVEPDSYEMLLDITLAMANAMMGAAFTGVARAAYEEALAYSKSRIQGGKPIFDHQMVKHRLFSMFTKVEASRALSRAAMIYNMNNTPPSTRYSIASKVFATQAAFEVASDAVQIFGGNGLSREYPVEKFFRDARAALIEDGANDVLMITGAHTL